MSLMIRSLALGAALMTSVGLMGALPSQAIAAPLADDQGSQRALYPALSRCTHYAFVEGSTIGGGQVQVVHDISGTWPEHLALKSPSPPLALEVGDLVLVVSCDPPPKAGGALPLVAPPQRIRRGVVRAAVSFMESWRARRAEAPEDQVDRWLGMLQHPWPVARQLGYETLMARREKIQGRLLASQISGLAEVLVEPERPAGSGAMVIRALTALAGLEGAEAIASKLPYIRGRKVRHDAVRALARYPSPKNRVALERCTRTGGSILAAHCKRALLKLPRVLPKAR